MGRVDFFLKLSCLKLRCDERSSLTTIRMHEIERPTYIKDAPRRVFDTHVHYPWRARGSQLPIYTADGMLDMLAYNCQRLNIYKLCLLGRPGKATTWSKRPWSATRS